MSKEEYLKGEQKEKIKEVIKECNILRLKTNEALVFIEKQTGKSISERTFRRFKQEMKDGFNARFGEMVKGEFVIEHLQRIDTLKKIEGEYWKNYNSTDSVPARKSILDSIAKIQEIITRYYNAEMTVKNFARWLDNGLAKIKKQQELTKQPLVDNTTVYN